MVINGDLLSIEVVGDIVNCSNYTTMDFLDEHQCLDMHCYTYVGYEMHLDFVNTLMIGIEKATKAYQE